LAATSDGEKLSAPQFYRGLEAKLAIAQRAGKKSRVWAIHAKIANRRKDSLHQFSTRLVRRYDTIFVGNVNASALAKTSHAKSVLDAGWSAFRTMLRYKCDFAGATFAEVNEAFSTQTCSACGVRSGPKGIAGLGIRHGLAVTAERSMTGTSTPRRTFSRRDVAVLQKESSPL
jgi:putative transposase